MKSSQRSLQQSRQQAESMVRGLLKLEAMMREYHVWQSVSPAPAALTSNEPFCVDTLAPLEWLQWIFIPRMQQLLATQSSLPTNMAIAPYFEMVLDCTRVEHVLVIHHLSQLDALLTQPDVLSVLKRDSDC